MNTKQLHYAIELANTLNFSKVSEKLNISQPALSKLIMNLENSLGVKLFDRTSTPMKLTAAGEHFIREAKELLYKENQLIRSMASFGSGEKGRLSIGASQFRSLYLLPKIVKELKSRYPGVVVYINDTNSEEIRKETTDGLLDFSIVNLPVDDLLFEYTPIEPDVLALAVPNEMLKLINKTPKDNFAQIDFKQCAKLPFIVTEQGKEMRTLFDKLCSSEEIHPQITMEVVGLSTALSMAKEGIGATLLPLQFAQAEALDNEKITLLTLKNDNFHRQPVIITRKGGHISEYAQYAIDLIKHNFKR